MSEDKTRFSARCQTETVDALDDLAEREGLNRSQAVEKVVREWGDLTNYGEIPPELVGGVDTVHKGQDDVQLVDAAMRATADMADTAALNGSIALGAALGMAILVNTVAVDGFLAIAGMVFSVVVGVVGSLNIIAGLVGTLYRIKTALGASNTTEDAPEVDEA